LFAERLKSIFVPKFFVSVGKIAKKETKKREKNEIKNRMRKRKKITKIKC
jgi:hypothetical protein